MARYELDRARRWRFAAFRLANLLGFSRDRERMDALDKFGFQKVIDGAMHIHTRFSFEGRTRNHNREMCLAARPRTGMACMVMGVVGHDKRGRLKGVPQFQFDPVAHRHRKNLSKTSSQNNGFAWFRLAVSEIE